MEMKHENVNHFGHEHLLIPLVLDEGDELYCKACELVIIEPFHGCLSCNYYLHDKCLNIPRSILHPSHPSLPLTLLPIPTYPSSSFTCNACRSQGQGFSNSCAHCEFDIHVQCASLPTKVKILSQHQHELKLAFKILVQDCTHYSMSKCDVCDDALETDQWRYYCSDCDFGIHLGCVKVDKDMGLMSNHCSTETLNSSLDGKSSTAQIVQPGKTVDNGEYLVEELRNEMMQHQFGLALQQHQFNLSASVAKLVKHL